EAKSLTEARECFEREYIIQTLTENNWKVAKAAEILNIDRANLYRKLRQLGIKVE
ncbi:MAG: helix-turn-helix domain-containing protein, partial [Candidatus Hodarchaeota archaeon]